MPLPKNGVPTLAVSPLSAAAMLCGTPPGHERPAFGRSDATGGVRTAGLHTAETSMTAGRTGAGTRTGGSRPTALASRTASSGWQGNCTARGSSWAYVSPTVPRTHTRKAQPQLPYHHQRPCFALAYTYAQHSRLALIAKRRSNFQLSAGGVRALGVAYTVTAGPRCAGDDVGCRPRLLSHAK